MATAAAQAWNGGVRQRLVWGVGGPYRSLLAYHGSSWLHMAATPSPASHADTGGTILAERGMVALKSKGNVGLLAAFPP